MAIASRPRAPLAVVAVAAAALAGCSTTTPQDDVDRELVIGVPFMAQTWNPLDGNAILFFLSGNEAAYENLIRLNNQTLEYDPVLAESYSLSEDRRTLSITLRDGIVFTDGEQLTAEAVKKNWDAVMESGVHYSATEFVAYDAAIAVTGDLDLEITTGTGINDRFFNAIAYLPIASPVALDDPELLTTKPVGTGPYILDEVVPDISSTYVRNPDYWNPEAYDFDIVRYEVFADRIAAANALRSGQIDVAQVDTSVARDLESADLSVHAGSGLVASLVWMDRDGLLSPPLADVRVRQAISYAFDREEIIDTLANGYGIVSSQAFISGQAPYVEGGDDRYPFDIEKSRSLMAEAGYADGFDITMPATPTGERVYTFEPIVLQTLADIGIRVTLETLPESVAWYEALSSGDYPLILFPMGDPYWVSYLSDTGFLSGNNRGPAHPAVAGILDRMDNGTPEESAEAAQELGEFLLEQNWYIPVARAFDTWASSPEIDFAVGRLANWPSQLIDISIAE